MSDDLPPISPHADNVYDTLAPNSHETREQRYQRQTTENFAALGRCIQEFELMVDAVRQGCSFFLGGTQMANLVLHNQVFTAAPLMTTLRAMITTTIRDNERKFAAWNKTTLEDVLAHLQKSFEGAASKRNALVHGTWYIGWASEDDTDFSSIHMYKGKITAKKLQIEQAVKNLEELNKLTAECQRICGVVQRLNGCAQITMYNAEGVALGALQSNLQCENGRWFSPEPRHTYC